MRLDERLDTGFEFIGLTGRPLVFVMRQLLPDLDGKLKIIGRTFRPTPGCFGIAGTVKGGIDLDDIEVSRVELQFVRFHQRIKQAGP